MLDWIKENSTAFAIAVVFHIIFLTALFFNWHFDKPDKIVLQQGDIIQVSAVDANSYDAEIKKIEQKKKADQRKKAQAKRKAQEVAKKKKQEKIRKKKEKQRKADELKRKKAADAKKKKAALKKAEQEKKRKKEAEKKKAAEEKLKKEKLKKEKLKKEQKKKAEQEKRRLEEKKKQQQAEQKRKAEADKKRQAELKRKEQRDRAERERRSKGIINRHVSLIQQKIGRSWRQPLDVPSGLKCKIEIALLPTGKVISVKVIESSGNLSFDRSVETAVRKASPLPVPADSVIFKEFEVMRLRFEPGSH